MFRRCEAEVAEARKLRDYVSNAEVLREKLRAAEARAGHAEAAAQATAGDAPAEVVSLRQQLDRWTTFYKVQASQFA